MAGLWTSSIDGPVAPTYRDATATTRAQLIDALRDRNKSRIRIDIPFDGNDVLIGSISTPQRPLYVSTFGETRLTVTVPSMTALEINDSSSAVVTGPPDSIQVRHSGRLTVGPYDCRGASLVDVHARDNALVEVFGIRCLVTANGNSTVRAHSSRVRAFGNVTVHAAGNSSVTVEDSATVHASKYTTVHRYGAGTTVIGGNVIDYTAVDDDEAAVRERALAWCETHDVVVDGDFAILYKAVNEYFAAGHDFSRITPYHVGTTVTAHDWRPDNDCGGGLHLSPRPMQASSYTSRLVYDDRFLRCRAPLSELYPVSFDKAKTRTCFVEAEVDAFGAETSNR